MKQDADAKSYAEAVAAAIKRLRLATDLSMIRLGESAGLSQPMIGLIERGIHTPTISTLFRISRALGTTPAKLLAEVEADTEAAVPEKAKPAKVRRKPVEKRRAAAAKRADESELKKRRKPL